jgi:hypothetical protein
MSDRAWNWGPPRLWPRRCESAVDYLGRVYGIEVYDYERDGRGLLICAGSGLMLSLMDQCPGLRWCLDLDTLRPHQVAQLSPWLTCVHNVCELVAVAGWYSATNPKPLATALRRLARWRVACYVQCHIAGDDPFDDLLTAFSLDQLIEQINAPKKIDRRAGARRPCS